MPYDSFNYQDIARIRRELEIRQASQTISQSVSQQIINGVNSVIGDSLTAEIRQLQNLMKVFEKESDNIPNRLFNIHQEVGQLAMKSVRRSYGQRVTALQSAASRTGYRAGRGRLPGALDKALKSEKAMFNATKSGLDYINVSEMDKIAAHWYRLNFGVGSRAGQSGQQYRVRFGGANVATVGFTTGKSSRPLIIPRGLFISSEGVRQKRDPSRRGADPFYPAGSVGTGVSGPRDAPIVSAGIQARNFLDIGVQVIARELPIRYQALYAELFKNASVQTRSSLNVSGRVQPVEFKVKLYGRPPRRADSFFRRGFFR